MTVKEWRKLIDFIENLTKTDGRFKNVKSEDIDVCVEVNHRLVGHNSDNVSVYPNPSPAGYKVKITMW